MARKGSDSRREQILDIAAQLFASRGFRVSLQEIAGACGVLPGSLYYHFVSKEALVDELVERYRRELDSVAQNARLALREGPARPLFERIVEFSEAIAECGVRNRAALLHTLYEPTQNASEEFLAASRNDPREIETVMLEILRTGEYPGPLRAGLDLALMAKELCHSMTNLVGVYHQTGGARNVPRIKAQMLLNGLALDAPTDERLDASPAFRTAQQKIATWQQADTDDAHGRLCAAARREFGRRGYEITTIRNIAAAAGMSTGAVYRLVRSKEDLLEAIMGGFEALVTETWSAVSASDSTPIEKLDAFAWLDINLLHVFGDELKIQIAWLRQSPPTGVSVGKMEKRIDIFEALLAEGERSGQMRVAAGNLPIRARCLVDLTWIDEYIVNGRGTATALALSRDTLIRGAMKPE